jgi:hypothetical protein
MKVQYLFGTAAAAVQKASGFLHRSRGLPSGPRYARDADGCPNIHQVHGFCHCGRKRRQNCP